MYVRQKNIHVALDNTCNWLFSTTEYNDWISRKNIEVHHGLLWIKGRPGAGKSTLMKEALHRAEVKTSKTGTTTAGFFFNARGTEILEKTPLAFTAQFSTKFSNKTSEPCPTSFRTICGSCRRKAKFTGTKKISKGFYFEPMLAKSQNQLLSILMH